MTAYDDIELDQSIEMSPDDATVFSEVPVEVAGVNNASGQFFRASTDKAAPPVRSRRGLKLLLVGAVVVVAASVAAYVVTSNNNKEDEANAKVASSNAARQLCVEGQVDTLKDANLELHLEGLSRPTNEEEQKVVEQAVLDAYNEVSGGCGDVYDRWVYKTTVTSQEVENLGEYQTALIATVQTTISCNDCPDDETFASTYPTTLARQLMHSLTRGSGVELTEGPRVRKNRESLNRLLQASTFVDAGMVIAKIEEIIADASDKQMIEGGFSGIQKVMINNQGSSIIYASTTSEYSAARGRKTKSEKTSKKCKKSSKKSKKESSMPSTSASPSVSVYPSSQPSISLAPSTSVYPSSQPSVSLAPSTSVYPSYSPSESVYPSLVPSTSVYPSSNPSVSLNPSMSLAPSTSASPSVSVYPSSKPSVSLAPSTSVYPSSQPSVSLSPSTSVYPSSQPSTRGTYSPSESVYPSLVPSTSVYPSSNPSVSLNPSASVYPSSQPSNSIAPSCEAE